MRGTKLNSHFFWSRDIMKSRAQYKTSRIRKSQLKGKYAGENHELKQDSKV